jgi:hypothetical protein
MGASVSSVFSATQVFADDKAGFLAASAATSIGDLPATGHSGTAVGVATFTNGPGASINFGNFSNEIAGNDFDISGPENFNLGIAGGAYSIGFDVHEPTYVGSSLSVNGCNAPCFDTTFQIQLFAGALVVGTFQYNAPDDASSAAGGPLGFFGAFTSMPFDRVEVRDLTNTIDNEFFGNFLVGNVAAPVPEPSSYTLLLGGVVMLAAIRLCRRRR